ncbi:hypothetical protein B0J14DRAFT_666461 [Halenospora varia]|nr:hypothetical protein B0J14DRAFT_666461 [Halenospora varia]
MQAFRYSALASARRASVSKILKFRRVFASGNGKPKTASEKDQSSAKEEDNPHTTTTEAQKLSFTPDNRRYALPDPNVLGIRGAKNPPGRILQALKHSLPPVERGLRCVILLHMHGSPPFENRSCSLVVTGPTGKVLIRNSIRISSMSSAFSSRIRFNSHHGQFGDIYLTRKGIEAGLQEIAILTSYSPQSEAFLVREIKVPEGFIVEFDNAAREPKSGAWKCARLSLNDERGF